MVKELRDEDFKESIHAQPLALVDFYASWCGPCRLFAPVFQKASEKHSNISFFKIDGDLHPESRSEITIDNLPYVALYKNGKFIKGHSTTTEHGLEAFIQNEVLGSSE